MACKSDKVNFNQPYNLITISNLGKLYSGDFIGFLVILLIYYTLLSDLIQPYKFSIILYYLSHNLIIYQSHLLFI